MSGKNQSVNELTHLRSALENCLLIRKGNRDNTLLENAIQEVAKTLNTDPHFDKYRSTPRQS